MRNSDVSRSIMPPILTPRRRHELRDIPSELLEVKGNVC